MPQLKALYNVIEYIFDRNASLLPAYFIVTEIQKDYPDNNHWPHWVSAFFSTINVEHIYCLFKNVHQVREYFPGLVSHRSSQ